MTTEIKWRCFFDKCSFVGTGEPNEFNGRFYCIQHDPRNNWVVAGYRHSDRAYGLGPFEVHRNSGETIKDVQDKIAEYAGEHPEIIYFVCRESDFRQYYQDILDFWFKGNGAARVARRLEQQKSRRY